MLDDDHLSAETLHMYLDEELGEAERRRAQAHLAGCAACRAELEALQRLFVALEELAPEAAAAPDLVPGVLARLHPHPRRGRGWDIRFRPRWALPAVQGLAALALLVWGWGWLQARGIIALQPVEFLQACWSGSERWLSGQWQALSSWLNRPWVAPGRLVQLWTGLRDLPEFTKGWVQSWAGQMGSWDLGLPLNQLALLAATSAILWIVGNTVLLRHARLNGNGFKR